MAESSTIERPDIVEDTVGDDIRNGTTVLGAILGSGERYRKAAACLRAYDFPAELQRLWGALSHRHENGSPVGPRQLAGFIATRLDVNEDVATRYVQHLVDIWDHVTDDEFAHAVENVLESSIEVYVKDRAAKYANGAVLSSIERVQKLKDLTERVEQRRADFRRAFGIETDALDMAWLPDIELDFERRELVAGLLDQSSMAVMYGASNSGKTFWAIDLAASIADGRDWCGSTVSQGPVIYVAAESADSVVTRAKAWCHWHQADGLPLAVVRSQVDLYDEDGTTQPLIDSIKRIAKVRGAPVLVVVDTLARAMGAGDENTAVDMGQLVRHCDRIRIETGAAILLVHHAGKDETKGARGSSALRAATDTELEVSDFMLSVKKQRDRESGYVYTARRATVELADSVGRTRETLTLYEGSRSTVADIEGKGRRSDRAISNQQLALNVLNRALESHGRTLPATQDHGQVFAVNIDDAATYAPDYYPLEDGDTCRKTFRRNIEQLGKRGLVGFVKPYVWLP